MEEDEMMNDEGAVGTSSATGGARDTSCSGDAAIGLGDGRDGDPTTNGSPLGLPGVNELEVEIVELALRLSTGTYELLVLIGEFDESGSWARSGALSCAAWLADVCGIEISTARNQVRVARAMRALPRLDAAMADGDVSYAKARVLAPHLSEGNAADLVSIARSTPAGRLGVAIAAWLQRHDKPEAIRARQVQMRSCSWRTDADGMVTLTARMLPEAAAVVCAVIDTHVMRARATTLRGGQPVDAPEGASEGDGSSQAPAGSGEAGKPGAPSGARHPGAPPGRKPSLAQQRHDALERAFNHCAGRAPNDEDAAVVSVSTEIVIHVNAEGNCLTDGTPLSEHAVTRLLPDAFISLLIHDTDRRPIDASPRRRSPTRRQRRVLDARQDECAHPGCTCRTFLQYDHRIRYTDGGTTTLDNLQRLCGPHNRARELGASWMGL
jgi:hypothetical protein